jgi:hypothetical protein
MKNIVVKHIENSKFEITFDKNGIRQQILITDNKDWVEEIGGYISHITSDNPDFYDIWGDNKFRKQVGEKIKEFSKMHELQAA